MATVIGIDHIYITVSDLARSKAFYDGVFQQVLGFRRNEFTPGGDPHVQHHNRHFGYVLHPARVAQPHEPCAPDYRATFFTDPDGVRLEVTNYRQERRDRYERWDGVPG